jgi:hypothetical protein
LSIFSIFTRVSEEQLRNFPKFRLYNCILSRHFVNIDANSRWPIKGDTRWLKIARKFKIIERKLENIYNFCCGNLPFTRRPLCLKVDRTQITQQMIKRLFTIHKRLDKRHKMQNIFTHVNQFYHSLVSAVCRGRIISLNSTPTMRGAHCPSFLAMFKPIKEPK